MDDAGRGNAEAFESVVQLGSRKTGQLEISPGHAQPIKVRMGDVYGLGSHSLIEDAESHDLKEQVPKVQVQLNQDSLTAIDVYTRLKQVTFNSHDLQNPGVWSGNVQIDSFINLAIKNCSGDHLAYYIAPINFGFKSKEGINNVAKLICRREGVENSCYGNKESLDKPFIIVSNTATVLARDPTDVNKQGGVHWISCVLLPKTYVPLSGKNVKNGKYQVYVFDSLGHESFPKGLKAFLTHGGEITEETDEGEKKISLLPFCQEDEIDFVSLNGLTGQQMNVSDCGWWATYYALMCVYTGGVEFLQALKEKKLSAIPLREVMSLQETTEHVLAPQLGTLSLQQENHPASVGNRQSCRRNQATDSARPEQINLNPPHFTDSDDEKHSERELFTDISNGNSSKVQELLQAGVNVNVVDRNNTDNTLLHYAFERNQNEIDKNLIFMWKAPIDAKNEKVSTPLDIAKSKGHCKLVTSIVNKLDGIETRKNKNQQGAAKRPDSRETLSFKVSKRKGTDGLHGNWFEVFLCSLAKLRGERYTDKFYLSTNVAGLGAFDDIVMRYWGKNGEESKSTTIFLQAKHKENAQSQISIDIFKNPNKNLYLGHFFSDYLDIRGRFNEKSKDPVFKGDSLVKYIFYTNAVLCHPLEKERIVNVGDGILYTKSKEDRAFKLSAEKNKDVIEVLSKVSSLKLLAKAVVGCISGKYNHHNMMGDEFIRRYHVFLAKNVIGVEEAIKGEKNSQYREGTIRQNFLFSDEDPSNKLLEKEVLYEYADIAMFKGHSSGFNGVCDLDNLVTEVAKLLKKSKQLDEDIFEKIEGILKFNKNKQQLKFANQNNVKDKRAAQFIKDLESKVGSLADFKFDISQKLLKKRWMEQIQKPLKLHIGFGNINPIFKNPDHLIKKLLVLFGNDKSKTVIKINDAMVGEGKKLTKGDIGNIKKLVGNMLVFNDEDKMLRFASEKYLNGNVLTFFKELQRTAIQQGLDVFSYRFDVAVKDFPSEIFGPNKNDIENAEDFLSKLEIFTGQAGNDRLEEIIKEEMQEFYRLPRKEIDDLFWRVIFEVEKFRKDGEVYLEKDDNFFESILKPNIAFNVRDPVALFTGREKELKDVHSELQSSSEKKMALSRMTCISGLGGIGKTELARKYVQEHRSDYNGNIIWINAESETSLTESFSRLAEDKLRINTKDANGEKKLIASIVEEVFEFFRKRTCLFVYDNAEEIKHFGKFLLQSSLTPYNKPYILITSRNQEFDKDIKTINLDQLMVEDAMAFVEKGMRSEPKEREALIRRLQGFPLAIQQAISYIKDQNFTRNYSISDYLNEFEKKMKDMLNSEAFKGIDNKYERTTFTTWKITIERIRSDECGVLALEVLNTIAYLAPENISREMFIGLKDNCDQTKLESAVRLLVKYSMVNGQNKQSILRIHRLVQEVTRTELEMNGENKKFMYKAFDILRKTHFDSRYSFPINNEKTWYLLPHFEVLLSHVHGGVKFTPQDEDNELRLYSYLERINMWREYRTLSCYEGLEILVQRIAKLCPGNLKLSVKMFVFEEPQLEGGGEYCTYDEIPARKAKKNPVRIWAIFDWKWPFF